MPQIAVGEATDAVWSQIIPNDVTDRELAQGASWWLADLKERRWPLPAEILDSVRKYRNWEHGRAVDQAECRACNGVGIVFTDDYRGLGVRGYTTCACPFGRSKAMWLEEERKKGFAWTSEEVSPQGQQRNEPTEAQEEIPF